MMMREMSVRIVVAFAFVPRAEEGDFAVPRSREGISERAVSFDVQPWTTLVGKKGDQSTEGSFGFGIPSTVGERFSIMKCPILGSLPQRIAAGAIIKAVVCVQAFVVDVDECSSTSRTG